MRGTRVLPQQHFGLYGQFSYITGALVYMQLHVHTVPLPPPHIHTHTADPCSASRCVHPVWQSVTVWQWPE